MRAYRTYRDVRVGHVITHGTGRLSVVQATTLGGSGLVLISGNVSGVVGQPAAAKTFKAGVKAEVVIHNWQE